MKGRLTSFLAAVALTTTGSSDAGPELTIHRGEHRMIASLPGTGSQRNVGDSTEFQVEVSDDLLNWSPLGMAEEVEPGDFRFMDASSDTAPQRFYRVVNLREMSKGEVRCDRLRLQLDALAAELETVLQECDRLRALHDQLLDQYLDAVQADNDWAREVELSEEYQRVRALFLKCAERRDSLRDRLQKLVVAMERCPEEDASEGDIPNGEGSSSVDEGFSGEAPLEEPEDETDAMPEDEIGNSPEGERGCCNGSDAYTPSSDFEMVIDDEWSDEEERAEIEAEFRELILDDSPEWQGFNVKKVPASATAIWKSGVVGGYASAYAKAIIQSDVRDNDWIGSTERLVATAEGTSDFSMTFEPEGGCTSFVVGVALTRISASSSVFDAVAGNTEYGLATVRTAKYLGQLSLTFLIDRGRRATSDSFTEYARKQIQEDVEGEIEEAVMNEIEALAGEQMAQLLNQLQLSADEAADPGHLRDALLDVLGIEIPSLDEIIAAGVEQFFNALISSDTYASATGSIETHVGQATSLVDASARAEYRRQGAEDSNEAVNQSGPDCDEKIVSDVQPNSLTITTEGFSQMDTQALGNGHADAILKSMNLQVLMGVCICGDEITTSYKFQPHYFTGDQSVTRESFAGVGAAIEAATAALMNDDSLDAHDPGNWQRAIEGAVREWARANPLAWNGCDR